MKTIFTIDTHSFVDVITNSSTELFVCDTDKSLEMVNETLKAKWIDWCSARFPTERELSDDIKYPWWYESTLEKDTIIIEWDEDNSISWEDQDRIEELFNAVRHHLG